LTKQLTELQTKYDTDTQNLNEKIKQNALNAALDLGITKAKGKNAKAIKALLDTSELTLKDDGTIDGFDTALDALKKSDSYLFENVETKPQGSGFHGGAPNPDAPETKAVADAFAAARGNF
jgi:elongation factor P hydroxylase